MAAPAPDSETGKGRSTKELLQEVGIFVNPTVALVGLAINKLWDPIADYVGYPCDRQRRMDDHQNSVDRVLAMRDVLLRNDPSPSNEQAVLWLVRAKQLEAAALKNREAFRSGNFFRTCRCAREAVREMKRAEDLASQFKDILVEPKPRLQPLRGTEWGGSPNRYHLYLEKLMNFIESKTEDSNCLGVWGMPGVGKTSLIKLLVTKYDLATLASLPFRVIFVDVGIDFTILGLQKSIFGQLGLTPVSDVTESSMAFAICNFLSRINFLVILDGMSVPVDLAALGIPHTCISSAPHIITNPAISAAPQNDAAAPQVTPTARATPDCAPQNTAPGITAAAPATPTALEITAAAPATPDSSTENTAPLITAAAPATSTALEITAAAPATPDSSTENTAPLITAAAPATPAATITDAAPQIADPPITTQITSIAQNIVTNAGSTITFQKVIITARSNSLCASMGCNETIHMMCPNEADAADIFGKAVGISRMKDERIAPLAKTIIKECGRVPEALIKVGRSLSIAKQPDEWKYALKLLKQCKMTLITYKTDDLTDRLKLSCDVLEDNLRACFLICSLWNPEEDIPINTLVRWWRGMGLIDDAEQGFSFVRIMQNHSLIECGQDTGMLPNEATHVRMNLLMQKVAVQILNDSKEKWAPNSPSRPSLTKDTWLTSQKVWLLPNDLDLLQRVTFLEKKLRSDLSVLICRCNINLERFEFKQIKFLDMEGVPLTTFPESICLMGTLEYLNLSRTGITSISLELAKLTKLKHLILRDNPGLASIPGAVMAGFANLKELDVFCTGCFMTSLFMGELSASKYDKLMIGINTNSKLEFNRLVNLDSVVSVLSICFLNCNNHIINLQWLAKFCQLRELKIDKCAAAKLVSEVTENSQHAQNTATFESLETIEICNLEFLAEIRLQITPLSITTVIISVTHKLYDLAWIENLINLENLVVSKCNMLSTLLFADVPEKKMLIMPSLKNLCLEDLPQLSTLSNCPIKLERLTYLRVLNCGSLTCVFAEKPREKVALNCDDQFWQTTCQQGNESWFTRVG